MIKKMERDSAKKTERVKKLWERVRLEFLAVGLVKRYDLSFDALSINKTYSLTDKRTKASQKGKYHRKIEDSLTNKPAFFIIFPNTKLKMLWDSCINFLTFISIIFVMLTYIFHFVNKAI
jgi:hypothetical protein